MRNKIVAALLAAFFASGSSLIAQEASEAMPKPTGKIIYVDTTDRNKNYLAYMNADGTEKKRLTPAYYNISFPKYCKKRNIIGFTTREPNEKTKQFDSTIYLFAKNKIKKFLIGATLEDFSPDGTKMLFLTSNEKSQLYAYNMASKKKEKICEDNRIVSARWSPKGEFIVATRMTDDNTTDLILISTSTKTVLPLSSTPGQNESFPDFLDDEASIIFCTDSNEHNEYEIEALAIERPLIKYKTGIKGIFPSVSPDKQWIAYENNGRVMIAYKTSYKQDLAQGRAPIWVENYEVESSSKNKKSPSKK